MFSLNANKSETVSTFFVVIVAFMVLIEISSTEANSEKNLRYLSERHFEFAIELYREMAKSRSGNLVISAHSVNVGLAMLFLGTTANTTSSQELRRTLNYENISYVNVHKSNKEVLKVLSEEYYEEQHNFINKIGLFVQKGAGIQDNYERAVREFYKSKIIDVDFGASGSGEIINEINR